MRRTGAMSVTWLISQIPPPCRWLTDASFSALYSGVILSMSMDGVDVGGRERGEISRRGQQKDLKF